MSFLVIQSIQANLNLSPKTVTYAEAFLIKNGLPFPIPAPQGVISEIREKTIDKEKRRARVSSFYENKGNQTSAQNEAPSLSENNSLEEFEENDDDWSADTKVENDNADRPFVKTRVIRRQQNPLWDDPIIFQTANPNTETLLIWIWNKHVLRNELVADVVVKLESHDIKPDSPMQISVETNSGKKGSVTLYLEYKKELHTQAIAKIGYFDKLGHLGVWQTRWFVLKNTGLYWYQNSSSDQALGSIKDFNTSELLSDDKQSLIIKRTKESFLFAIKVSEDKTYHFKVKSKEDKDEWVKALSLQGIKIQEPISPREATIIQNGYVYVKAKYKKASNSIVKFAVHGLMNATRLSLRWNAYQRSYASLKRPKGYWNVQNQRDFFLNLGKNLKLKNWEDWYLLSVKDVLDNGGNGIMKYYNKSLAKALITLLPEYPWREELFEMRSQGTWSDRQKRVEFFDWMFLQLNLTTWEDWYHVEPSKIRERGGAAILSHFYDGYHIKALIDLYPERKWKIWNFDSVPREIWTPETEREFVEHVGSKLNVKDLDDWYGIRKVDFDMASLGIGSENYLRICHNGSLPRALMSVYPDHEWKQWRFTQSPKGTIFQDESKVLEYLEWISKELGIQTLDDWYHITWAKLNTIEGSTAIRKRLGGLVNTLTKFYPDHNWDLKRFQGHWKSQHALFLDLQDLFPECDILVEYPHPQISFGESNREMTLDLYIPSLELAFEYQGKQHYEPSFRYNDGSVPDRDREKREACNQIGITLVEIPYWWDQKKESLVATIRKYRPDLKIVE